MKRRFAVCIILMLVLVLSLGIAQVEETSGAYPVTLEVDGGFLRLMMPKEYQYQETEPNELEPYPFSYTFLNAETDNWFIVYSHLDNQKDQKLRLKKINDKSNCNRVLEHVQIGELTYIVYTKEAAAYDFGFLLETENGYSYQFEYCFADEINRNEIPGEAVAILSALQIEHDGASCDQ